MVRKLHIKENVVSDMYRLKIINMDIVKNYLHRYVYDINLEDCSLVPIDKPRTYAVAKKNIFPILGVGNNYSVYVGSRNGGYKRGPAVVGIYGKGEFFSVAGSDKIRSNFEECESFYQVVPDDVYTYQSRYDIAKNRTHTVDTKLDDAGRIDDSSKNTLHKNRAFTDSDLADYNPETNRKRYIDILTKNHLDNFVDDYNDACSTVKAFQNRLNNIDITTVNEYSYGNALDSFKNLISRLKSLNRHIEDIRKGNNNTWYHPTESDIESDIDRFDDAAIKLEKRIQDLEK